MRSFESPERKFDIFSPKSKNTDELEKLKQENTVLKGKVFQLETSLKASETLALEYKQSMVKLSQDLEESHRQYNSHVTLLKETYVEI